MKRLINSSPPPTEPLQAGPSFQAAFRSVCWLSELQHSLHSAGKFLFLEVLSPGTFASVSLEALAVYFTSPAPCCDFFMLFLLPCPSLASVPRQAWLLSGQEQFPPSWGFSALGGVITALACFTHSLVAAVWQQLLLIVRLRELIPYIKFISRFGGPPHFLLMAF